jgi:hypothetical protein
VVKLIGILLFTIICLTSFNFKFGYDFSKPIVKDILPASLQEISGLAIIDSTTIACIQDENGILFLYDTKNHKIKQQYIFGLNGDYEGITKVGELLYVLRSDGVLFELKNYSTKKNKCKNIHYKSSCT